MSLPFHTARQQRRPFSHHVLSRRRRWSRRILDGIQDRMKGPGGYYNLGNILGLCVALMLQLHATKLENGDVAAAVQDFFLGNPAAISLTFATVVFLVSGEIYRAAWTARRPASQHLKRAADLVSAIGAILLSLSLMCAGQAMLAIVSGILIAGGKLGSALTGDDPNELPLWPLHWPDPLRSAVAIGRLPGLAAAAINFFMWLPDPDVFPDILYPATLILCYLLWIKADLMLVDGARFRPSVSPT